MKNYWNNFYALLSFAWILTKGECQNNENTPPTVWLSERHWTIPDTEPVGSKIAQAHGNDAEGDTLVYGLEPRTFPGRPPPKQLPFRIDPNTAVIYLNESLEGKAGEDIHLYVTASDDHFKAKAEVWVSVQNGSAPLKTPAFPNNQFFSNGVGGIRPPPGLNFSPFNQRPSQKLANNPPPSIANNPPPLPGYPTFHPGRVSRPSPPKESTVLRPVQGIKQPADQTSTTKTESSAVGTSTSIAVDKSVNKANEDDLEEDDDDARNNLVLPVNQNIKSIPDMTTTLVPILSVCGVFVVVGIIAFICRKKIHLGKVKSPKDEKSKENNGIVLQEDPALALQTWRGPRAFSNRYEPWDREGNHIQAGHQISNISSTIKNVDRWEFPRHRLKFFNILGEGAFGQVWKCEALDMDGKDGLSIVAVKTLKENASEKERSDLLSELQVMKTLEPHSNVVRLLGCCTDKEPIFLIMEYISKGKLQSYLRNSRAERYYNNMHGPSKCLTSRDLTSFVYQVAKGMEFLSSNGIIHRDLAARNILITDEHICKVADFGFARDVISSMIYERKSEGRLPIRWMAPESLYDNIFSVKSDVWSFGVLIWEVVTLGSTPYPGLSAAEVMKKVRDGYRLEKPEHCRRELYNIMYYCWAHDPKQRPTFGECIELLEKLLMTETDYIELERFPDHSYYNMVSLSGEKL